MKNLLSLLISAVLLATPLAFAQSKVADVGDGAETVDTIENPEDATKLQARERRARIDEQFGITQEQRAQMRKIRKEGGSREEIRAVMTEEQREQMRQWRREHPDQFPPKKGKKDRKEKKNNPGNSTSPDAAGQGAETEAGS